jgi:hypothetical protein
MMKCKCGSERIANINVKCNDAFFIEIEDCEEGKSTGNGQVEYHGYVPRDLGIGGGDYVKLSYCLDCGQIQGDHFPLENTELEAMGDDYEN